jgi:hypothetical protein
LNDVYNKMFEEAIIPLVQKICQYWSPPKQQWNFLNIMGKANASRFCQAVTEYLPKGMWSLEEVNSLNVHTMGEAEIKLAVAGLWYEFAVLCGYLMPDFETYNTGKNWHTTKYQRRDQYWSDISRDKLFRTGGSRLQAIQDSSRARGVVQENGAYQEYEAFGDGRKTKQESQAGITKQMQCRNERESKEVTARTEE